MLRTHENSDVFNTLDGIYFNWYSPILQTNGVILLNLQVIGHFLSMNTVSRTYIFTYINQPYITNALMF